MDSPTDGEIRDLYSQFGLAYYWSEVLHRGLCIILAMLDVPTLGNTTRPMVEERLARAFNETLGEVIQELDGKLPPIFTDALQAALASRNSLAHHFWFDRAHLLFRRRDVEKIARELEYYRIQFQELEEKSSRWFEGRKADLGLTDRILDDSLQKLLDGEGEEPLPGKRQIKEWDKRLKNVAKLVSVWEFMEPNVGRPLVFELEDGTLWQPSDLGLGWTRFTAIGAEWQRQPKIAPFLPAAIASKR